MGGVIIDEMDVRLRGWGDNEMDLTVFVPYFHPTRAMSVGGRGGSGGQGLDVWWGT